MFPGIWSMTTGVKPSDTSLTRLRSSQDEEYEEQDR
jgi:hypothetical protein